MKIRRCLLLVTVIGVWLCGCGSMTRQARLCFGFDKSEFTVLEEQDSHGGFLGDGSYSLILDCSENQEKAAELINNWKPLPLTENLNLVMYGGEKDGTTYGYSFAEEAHWPEITNGVYQFRDRYNEDMKDRSDDTNLINRESFNFSVAVYDFDNHVLYFYALDT